LIEPLFPRFAGVTDAWGTNTHVCLSVVRFIESLTLACSDLDLANLNVLDPTTKPRLRSGFAF
jgi:hypothetical protein